MTDDRFMRTSLVFGEDALVRLAACRVAVFGVGGVGGYVVEALARSGVGALDIVDADVVDVTNINRQIVALSSTVGRPKVDVARERVLDINPDCRVTAHRVFYLPEVADMFDFTCYDYVVDAVDTVSAKLEVIERAVRAGVPVISSMGAGNKVDPCAFRVADIYSTSIDPLAKVMRHELRRRGITALKVVYSTEPVPAGQSAHGPGGDAAPVDGRRAPRVIGSTAFVPPVAGFAIASEVVKDLIAAAPE